MVACGMRSSEAAEALQALFRGLEEELKQLTAELEGVTMKLEAATESLAGVKEQLADKSRHLSKAQADATVRHDEEIFAKRQEIRSLTKQIEDRRGALEQVTVDLKNARAEHAAIEASLEALRRRHFG